MGKFKKWLTENTGEGRKSLFSLTAVLTLIYFSLILLRFLKGVNFADIPPAGVVVYITLLSAYVGVKSLDKVKNNNIDVNNKQRGELFFVAWTLLYGALWLLTGLHKGEAVVLQETQSTVLTVIGIFVGTESLKFITQFFQERKNGQIKTQS